MAASADVGGVADPVAAAGSLPGDGDGDVDAEHAGEQCGGQVGGELEQCGGAGLSGLDSEFAEPFGQSDHVPDGVAMQQFPVPVELRRGRVAAPVSRVQLGPLGAA